MRGREASARARTWSIPQLYAIYPHLPRLDSARALAHPRGAADDTERRETDMGERELTYGEAVKEAIAEEMRRDPRVFLIGEDVAEAGHPFKTLTGLVQEFGTQRIIDTPISEPGYAGIGVGAAMTGMRPIVDVMFGDFITLDRK